MKRILSLFLSIIMLVSCVGSIQFSASAGDLVPNKLLELNTSEICNVYFDTNNKKVYYKIVLPYAGMVSFNFTNNNTIGTTEAKVVVYDALFSNTYAEYTIESDGKPSTINENLCLYSGEYFLEVTTVNSYGYSLLINAKYESAPGVNSTIESPNRDNDILLGVDYTGVLISHFNYYGFELNKRCAVRLSCQQNKSLVFCLMGSNATDEKSREQMEAPSATFQYVLEPGRYYLRFGGNGLFWSSEQQLYKFKLEYVTPENCTHEFKDEKISSTCTSQGYTIHTCGICGYSYADDYKVLASHNFTSQTVYPTYFASGYTVYSCKTCGYSYTDNYKAKLKVNVPSVSSLKKGKKKITVYISNAYNIDGIQISYSTSKKFTKSKTKTVSTKKTTKTLTKLSNKKKYYVKVRGYKIINGKKVYSSWSKVKSVKTK